MFTIENAIPFSVLESDPTLADLEKYIIPTQDVLSFETFTPAAKDVEKLFNGMTVFTDYTDGLYKIYKDESFYGILEVQDKKAKIKTKLC